MASSSSSSSKVPLNPVPAPNFIPETPSFEEVQKMYRDLQEQKNLLQQEKDEFDVKSSAGKTRSDFGGMGSPQSYYGNTNRIAQVKLLAPPPFDGTKTDAATLLGFISSTRHYLKATGFSEESPESLVIALQSIRGHALLWYDSHTKRSPVKSWNELEQAMRARYYPASQEQKSLSSILNCKYRGSIEGYNNAFLNHAQMLPSFDDPNVDPVIMGMYVNGIRSGSGSAYLLTVLQDAISEKRAKNIMELMSIAVLTENNLNFAKGSSESRNRVGQPVRVPYVPNGSSYKSSSPPYRPPQVRSESSSSKPSLFYTPQKLNQLEINEAEQLCENGREEGESAFDPEPDVEQLRIHEEQTEAEDPAMLLALRQFDKFKKADGQLTPEEYARRRKEQLCYRCGKPSHVAKECRSIVPPPQKK